MPEQTAISKETLSSRVYDWVLGEILKGNLRQGERLNDQTIAEQLGVSPTPVREALRRLRGSGLVEYIDRKGVRVISLQEQDIVQCFSVRNALERLALREALPLMTPEDKEELLARATDMSTARGHPAHAVFEKDRRFHAFIVEKAGNAWLTESIDRLAHALTVARLELFKRPDVEKTALEHMAIARAVQAGKLTSADTWLDKHIRRVCASSVASFKIRAQEKSGGSNRR